MLRFRMDSGNEATGSLGLRWFVASFHIQGPLGLVCCVRNSECAELGAARQTS